MSPIVIALGAKLAKADGTVTPEETAAFHRMFHVDPGEEKNLARVFNLARQRVHGYEAYARQIAGMFKGRPAVLEELLDCLFHIARADGKVSDSELDYLRNVARIFGLSDAAYRRIHATHLGQPTSEPYDLLGVSADADDDEVKAAYRKLVLDNHPDKLVAQGMPEDFVAVANEKLAAINGAYEEIRRARGLR